LQPGVDLAGTGVDMATSGFAQAVTGLQQAVGNLDDSLPSLPYLSSSASMLRSFTERLGSFTAPPTSGRPPAPTRLPQVREVREDDERYDESFTYLEGLDGIVTELVRLMESFFGTIPGMRRVIRGNPDPFEPD
jgi:hypothetical protein